MPPGRVLRLLLLASAAAVAPGAWGQGTNSSGGGDGGAELGADAGSGVACAALFSAFLCCAEPVIDPDTQQPADCQPNHVATMRCYAQDGVRCGGTTHQSLGPGSREDAVPGRIDYCRGRLYNASQAAVTKEIGCCHVSRDGRQYDFGSALSLSVFLGMLGLDRFYLGYPAIGLLKLCTFGFCMFGQLVDALLIASHVVGPADGSCYKTPFLGTRAELRTATGQTFVVPP